MLYIYKYQNKINGKIYIGQTNNIQNRVRCHKSDMNKYNNQRGDVFHAALKKYGYDNFTFEVLEEIDDEMGRDYLDEREIYYIALYQSLTTQNGYNISKGGRHGERVKLTFEERCVLSKKFDEAQIRDIQQMLIDGYQFFEIQEKYPQLGDSFITNINAGVNFKRDDLEYPLLREHSRYSKSQQDEIIGELVKGTPYSKICEKYGISIGALTAINNGERWCRKGLEYPLSKKKCADTSWHKGCVYDILFTNLSYEEIGKKYNRTRNAVKAVAVGKNGKRPEFLYSLRKHLEENRETYNNLFK